MNHGNGGDAGELTLADRRVLATTIDPRHFAPEAIARVRKAMDAHPNRHAVIDEFLLPAHLGPLRELVAGDRAFDPNLKVSLHGESVAHLSEAERRSPVDPALFESVPDADRFISQEIFREGQPRDTRGAHTDALVRKVLGSPAMHRLMGAMSGMELSQTLTINLKRHGPGHFLRRHSDATGGRRLCGVLYLHDHWEPAYGGRFLLYREDGSHFAIDPAPNRLVLFDVTVRNDHAIEEMGSVPAGWWRSNYSVWFR